MCLFMTTWGDGIFHVFSDFDEQGQLVSVTLKLETEVTAAQRRSINVEG